MTFFFDNSPAIAAQRRIFVSYHHDEDQAYYNQFSRVFSESYEMIYDNSLDRIIDSTNAEYVMRNIRENYITGTSCTVVLCGAQTPWRKYIDWEIKATLDREHGLIGINLPSNRSNQEGKYVIPDRLHDNIVSGYAVWITWQNLAGGPSYLRNQIEIANARAKNLINNSRLMRQRNG